MSATVKISLRAARALFDLAIASGGRPGRPMDELEAAIAKATRASATRRKLRQPKEAKRQAKRQQTKDVRAAVEKRAGGNCEACGNAFLRLPQMDHFFGKARAESVETCWLLDPWCHGMKTRNSPSSARWLEVFAAHCDKHGYSAEAAKARARLAFVEARGGA